jgi:hypothetical protein
MNSLVFGYGYMGRIRYQILRRHPDVKRIFVVDPGMHADSLSSCRPKRPTGVRPGGPGFAHAGDQREPGSRADVILLGGMPEEGEAARAATWSFVGVGAERATAGVGYWIPTFTGLLTR